MDKIAIIGGGISGLSIAHILSGQYEVRVFEQESRPGGLIKCKSVHGHLYHMVGGHVFNSKREDVLNWFWNFFDIENEFSKAFRNAVISLSDGSLVGYPIENHIYMMDKELIYKSITDLLEINKNRYEEPQYFEIFLRNRFGKTLYDNYFKSYNEKIWRKDLKEVPLSWLEGKLPMPTIEEIIYNNFCHAKEMGMVHSSFYYAKSGGSQFLADRLAQGLDIVYNEKVYTFEKGRVKKYNVNGYECDKIIYCGNIKKMPEICHPVLDISMYENDIENLEYHGTTSVLCEIEKNPYSWIYLPDNRYQAHRIICTGNFAESNHPKDKMSATIEFTDFVSKEDIDNNLINIPFSPRYLDHQYTQYTYPIQNVSTREMIYKLKERMRPFGIYLLGRFAEWEYYNMDAAIGAALDLKEKME